MGRMKKADADAHPSPASHSSHSPIGAPERATQNRVLALFQDKLGYRFIGDWTDLFDTDENDQEVKNGCLCTAWASAGSPTSLHAVLSWRDDPDSDSDADPDLEGKTLARVSIQGTWPR